MASSSKTVVLLGLVLALLVICFVQAASARELADRETTTTATETLESVNQKANYDDHVHGHKHEQGHKHGWYGWFGHGGHKGYGHGCEHQGCEHRHRGYKHGHVGYGHKHGGSGWFGHKHWFGHGHGHGHHGKPGASCCH